MPSGMSQHGLAEVRSYHLRVGTLPPHFSRYVAASSRDIEKCFGRSALHVADEPTSPQDISPEAEDVIGEHIPVRNLREGASNKSGILH